MKNKILAFGLCVAVFLGLFGFAVSASSPEMSISNVYTTEDGYTFDIALDAQSVSGNIFVAQYNAAGGLIGVQTYDAAERVRVEIAADCERARVFWWDVSSALKPMVKEANVVPMDLNDIEDGGKL